MTFVDEKLIKCVEEKLTQIRIIRIDSGTSLAEGLKQGFNIEKKLLILLLLVLLLFLVQQKKRVEVLEEQN
jgi:hypothetical protein